MAKDRCIGPRSPRAERARLRGAVLRLGGRFGWQPAAVIAFAEVLAGRPWRRLAAADFRLVLEEYAAILDAIEAKAGRGAGSEGETVPSATEVQRVVGR